ncbi:hypothetical protein SAMD00019534_023820 [Acytostelium subglobosum LB1]|uniref:hypothetical protein n=1 Tax=Acytostelium subglobosum LB1 TaxID=1410327 RepID=UPI00064498B3|nr:hypothetical protein SAMD00019534_023820 [Acytostelium subglobosum LB1]GAM19207.1 hypothetical protein SAMD00019534_023820 [Acytostelium subglobosum LB1]|eukprot:XP_012757134.1 hypothetical protein SAMD00019534_023820 [Acytostelium subglobosum LB1]
MISDTTPTLTYFNARARGELTRLLLNYLDVEFNDVRVAYPLDKDLKASLPFGQLPMFKDNDVTLVQSTAIESYIANKYNIAGTNDVERAQIHQYVLATMDVYNPFFLVWRDEALVLKYTLDKAPLFLPQFESIVNQCKGEYLVGDTLSWADLAWFNMVDYFTHYNHLKDVIKNYPALIAFHKRIGDRLPERTKQYLKSRESTPV